MQWPLVGREAALDHALELVGAGTGIALLGPAGVGKSRLLHEMADRAEQAGKAVVRAVASVSTRTIPFGAFVELLPDGPTQDRLSMLGAARASLEGRSSSRGLLLAVDDAHHLDEASLALLVSIVTSGIATVALTARTGELMEPDLVDLWTNGVIERLDMGPLERSEQRLLIEARLGEISNELEAELWRLAEGNPLVLHELIEGAIGSTLERDDDGVWVWAGSLTDSARLSDLVSSRLHHLPEDVRPAMDVVAVGSPLPIDLAREAIGPHVESLEGGRFVTTMREGFGEVLVPAHPLYGEVLKSHIGESRIRAASRALVEASARLGETIDPLRPALWQRDCGEVLFPELAMAGAHEALVRHEPGLAEEILRPLGTDDDRVAILLGRALSYRQRFGEAEELLAGRQPVDDALLGEITSIRAQNLGFGLGKVLEARTLLHDVAARIDDADLRARLINERAMVSAIHGDFVDSMASSDQVLSDPDTSVVPRAAAYVTLTVALAMTGDCDRMDEVIDDALRVSAEAKEVLPFARDQVGVMQMSSALHAGRIPEAVRLCSQTLDNQEGGNAMRTTWLSASVMALDLSGRLSDAKAAAHEALEIYAEADPFGLEAQTRGILALSSGQMGQPVPDESFRIDHPQAGPRLTVWVNRGRAWSAAAREDLESAVQIAHQAGRSALEGEHDAWATFCFSDAVRFGRPDVVVGELDQIDSSRGAHLLDAIKRHARASASGSPDELRSVAERFARFCAWLLAAESYAQASTLYEVRGQLPEAATSAALSMVAEGRCQEPRTPALAARPGLVTPREMEVALDAARGRTGPEISKSRYISVRTVDNHLSSVYRKLGISGREELAATLSPVMEGSDAPRIRQ
ncbi:MAG: AAA family ATPase [Acidimicrobiia bacterium]|jgi:DNA-binding NarL/FixJ family response regulator